ncbi:MAG: spore coat protein [Treponema sp.]|nr:spore coat protein [Treponema sp.]
MTAVVLQARLDSSRLPGKAKLLLGGEPLIFRVMEALNNVPADIRILACPEDSLSVFTPLAQKCGFEIFAGPKDDVLERYCQVIRHYSITRVIRATGDNPFVFADAACTINAEAAALDSDYAGFMELPHGAGVESVSAKALLRAANEAALPSEREHVCPYLYKNPQLFKLHRPFAPEQWRYPDIRLTVDTQEDYDKAVKLYETLINEPNRYNGSVIINAYKSL